MRVPQARRKKSTSRLLSCVKDEGRPLEVGFQKQALNHPERLRLRGVVVSVGLKALGDTLAGTDRKGEDPEQSQWVERMKSTQYGFVPRPDIAQQPHWPDISFEEVLNKAFSGDRYVDSLEHEVLNSYCKHNSSIRPEYK